MVGASADHFGHVLSLLVYGCGPEDGARRRLLTDNDFHRARLCKLAVKFVKKLRILRESTVKKQHHNQWSWIETFKKKKKKKKISIKVPQNKFDYSFFSKEPKPNYMFSSLHKYGQTDQAKRRYFTLLSSILTLPVLEEEVQEHVPSCQSCALQPDCTSPTDQSTSRQGREFQGRPP